VVGFALRSIEDWYHARIEDEDASLHAAFEEGNVDSFGLVEAVLHLQQRHVQVHDTVVALAAVLK
jgi:acyl carrier protein